MYVIYLLSTTRQKITKGITHEKVEDTHMKMLAVVLEQLIQQLTLTKGTCAASEVFVVIPRYTALVSVILVCMLTHFRSFFLG